MHLKIEFVNFQFSVFKFNTFLGRCEFVLIRQVDFLSKQIANSKTKMIRKKLGALGRI